MALISFLFVLIAAFMTFCDASVVFYLDTQICQPQFPYATPCHVGYEREARNGGEYYNYHETASCNGTRFEKPWLGAFRDAVFSQSCYYGRGESYETTQWDVLNFHIAADVLSYKKAILSFMSNITFLDPSKGSSILSVAFALDQIVYYWTRSMNNRSTFSTSIFIRMNDNYSSPIWWPTRCTSPATTTQVNLQKSQKLYQLDVTSLLSNMEIKSNSVLSLIMMPKQFSCGFNATIFFKTVSLSFLD